MASPLLLERVTELGACPGNSGSVLAIVLEVAAEEKRVPAGVVDLIIQSRNVRVLDIVNGRDKGEAGSVHAVASGVVIPAGYSFITASAAGSIPIPAGSMDWICAGPICCNWPLVL
jgi:hypothetical protein